MWFCTDLEDIFEFFFRFVVDLFVSDVLFAGGVDRGGGHEFFGGPGGFWMGGEVQSLRISSCLWERG